MTPNRREEHAEGLAAVVMGVAAVAFAASSACWAAARASLWLAGRPGSHSSLERATTFTIVLLGTGDAAAAWERAYPGAAPLDPVAFWSVLTLVLLLLIVAAGLVAVRWLDTHDRAEHASWATRRVERKLAAPRDPAKRRWRLVAGRSRTSRRLLAGHDCVSAVAFGPNGSGKTTGLVVPNVLDWDGPVVFTTAKPQDLEPVCSARAERGPVWVIAPAGAPGHDLAGWSPVDAAVDAEAADRIAEWMVDASGMAEDAKARPWNAQARKYLKGLLLAAHHTGGGMLQWIDWIHAGERARDHVEEALRDAREDRAAQDYRSTWQIHDEGKGSVLFTALGLADTYSRPDILSAATGTTLDVGDLLDGHGTLCIVTPSSNADRFAAYFTTLISAIIHEAETRAARQGGPLEPRLLLALDEAGNVFRYPRLPHLLTTSRGNGIQLLLIYHDLAQLEHLYAGRDVARTVVSNAKLRLLLPGVGDLETLRYWSDLMGQARFETHGVTTGYDGKRSRSRNEHTAHLAPLHQLQQLPDGQAVLLYQNLPPARIRLLPWFTDHRFRHLREPP